MRKTNKWDVSPIINEIIIRRKEDINDMRRVAAMSRVSFAVMALLLFLSASCAPSGLTGVVQSSRIVQGGYELSLGTSPSADYVFVEAKVLLDLQGIIAAQRDSKNLLLLGNQYVGRRIRVSGAVERDSAGRRFVRVSSREQIELL